jgi:predicted DNA-binding WGR domain protein
MPEEAPSPTSAASLAAENAALKAKIAEFNAAKKQADADEILIAEKMAKGLRREQATAVLKRQREFDARKERLTAKG